MAVLRGILLGLADGSLFGLWPAALICMAVCIVGCGEGPGAGKSPAGSGEYIVLKEGFPGRAEALVEYDASGQQSYRLVFPPSGRRKPWGIAGGKRFSSVAALAEGIRGLNDVHVTASDPRDHTSMWIIGDNRVEPLSAKEIGELQALLANTENDNK